jgi:hypothetical protein
MPAFISPEEIKKQAGRWYPDFLAATLRAEDFFPRDIRFPKMKSSALAKHFGEVHASLVQLRTKSKEAVGQGYTVEWEEVNNRTIGRNRFPVRIFVAHQQDYLSLLSAERRNHFQQFEGAVAQTRETFPLLEGWMPGNEKKLGDYGSVWADLLRVCDWFVHHYEADRYFIRELPIRVHTKFVEQHKAILSELLTYLLPPHRVRSEFTGNREHNFERRFGLKYDETLVRFRLLDQDFLPGMNDLSIPHSVFAQTPLPETQGIITENKINFLTLPVRADTFAIFGGGFNIHLLRHADWLHRKHLYYWGDLDAHGFLMLAQLRQLFGHVDSLMMDRATFDTFYAGDNGPPAANVNTDGLREDEQELFHYLQENNLRLEQEKIPYPYVLTQLDRVAQSSN